MRASRRVRLLIVAFLAALALPGVAQAHHTAVPIVALDYRNRLLPQAEATAGVRASLEDAGRKLRLTVSPGHVVLVTGYLREPFLRFSTTGVSANARSATAQSLRLVPSGPISSSPSRARWRLLTRGHSLSWADTRSWASSSALGNRKVVAWSVPVTVDGRRTAIRGELTRSARPSLWPWLLVVAALAVLAVAVARGKRRIWSFASGLAAAAGLATAANMSGFALSGLSIGADRWTLFGVELLLTFLALAALTRTSVRLFAVAALAAFAVLESLSELAVFRHGVVVSALPAAAVRLAAAIGLGAGLGAAGLVFVAPTQTAARGRTRRNPRPRFTPKTYRKEQA